MKRLLSLAPNVKFKSDQTNDLKSKPGIFPLEYLPPPWTRVYSLCCRHIQEKPGQFCVEVDIMDR
eukprot:13791983-Ditylum_brightwellii.AAC.1